MLEDDRMCNSCWTVKSFSEFSGKSNRCKFCTSYKRALYIAEKLYSEDPESYEIYMNRAYRRLGFKRSKEETHKSHSNRINRRRELKRLKEEDPKTYQTQIARVKKNYAYKKYDLTLEQVEQQGELQGWRCRICGNDIFDRHFVDHDHQTGQFRGLLCPQCNFGLGHFRDSIYLLEKAIEYLNECEVRKV